MQGYQLADYMHWKKKEGEKKESLPCLFDRVKSAHWTKKSSVRNEKRDFVKRSVYNKENARGLTLHILRKNTIQPFEEDYRQCWKVVLLVETWSRDLKMLKAIRGLETPIPPALLLGGILLVFHRGKSVEGCPGECIFLHELLDSSGEKV